MDELLELLVAAGPVHDPEKKHRAITAQLRRAVEVERRLRYLVGHAQIDRDRGCWMIPLASGALWTVEPSEEGLQAAMDQEPDEHPFDQSGPEIEWAFQRACTELVMRHIDRMNDVCDEDPALRIIESFRRRFEAAFDVYMNNHDLRMPSWRPSIEPVAEPQAAFLNEGTIRVVIDGAPNVGKSFVASAVAALMSELGVEYRFTSDDGINVLEADPDAQYVEDFVQQKPVVAIFERHAN